MAVINTNTSSLNAQRNLSASASGLATSLQRLSSGLRINSAKDDAAGLAIADRMTTQIRGNNVAIRNANDGISLVQTAEGAMGKIGDNLQRMRELAVQSRNATNGNDDRDALNNEFGELAKEVQRIAGGTTFNGLNILGKDASGSLPADTGLKFQVGAGTTVNDSIEVKTTDMTKDATIVAVAGGAPAANGTPSTTPPASIATSTVAADTNTDIGKVIDNIDTALKTVNKERATYGAVQNRFDSVVSNLQVSVEAQSASRSRIMDTDFAAETANLTRGQILQQAGTAMLAQANSLPNGVLSLLRG
jgi:flagellin